MLEASGLIGIMHQQSRLVADLENLIKEQLQALQQDDLNKITAVTNQQEYIGRRIAELEEQRLRMMEDYSRMTGFEMKHFHDLQQQVTQRDWHELQTLREEITNSSQAIKGINELNALLLKQGLKYAERMLHILHPNQTRIYGKSGDLKPESSRAMLDKNV